MTCERRTSVAWVLNCYTKWSNPRQSTHYIKLSKWREKMWSSSIWLKWIPRYYRSISIFPCLSPKLNAISILLPSLLWLDILRKYFWHVQVAFEHFLFCSSEFISLSTVQSTFTFPDGCHNSTWLQAPIFVFISYQNKFPQILCPKSTHILGWLRVLAAFAKDTGLVLNTHMTAHNPL